MFRSLADVVSTAGPDLLARLDSARAGREEVSESETGIDAHLDPEFVYEPPSATPAPDSATGLLSDVTPSTTYDSGEDDMFDDDDDSETDLVIDHGEVERA